MDESKHFTAHATTYTSHPSTLSDIRGGLHTARIFPSDKSSNLPISGAIPASSPLGHTSPATSTSLPTNEVRPVMVSRGLPSSNLGRDSSSLPLQKVEKPQFKSDGGLNGSSFASQVQGNFPLL